MVDFRSNDIKPHFIHCYGYYFNSQEVFKKLKEIILKKMREYGIQSSILTMLKMVIEHDQNSPDNKRKIKRSSGRKTEERSRMGGL